MLQEDGDTAYSMISTPSSTSSHRDSARSRYLVRTLVALFAVLPVCDHAGSHPAVVRSTAAAHSCVRQWSRMACGPAALATILNEYRLGWNQSSLERACHLGPDGCSMADLAEAAEQYGLRPYAWQLGSAAAYGRIRPHYIAHLRAGHFVVVLARDGDKLSIFDPRLGKHETWRTSDLQRYGSGWVIRFER
jgi:predicted double-glycine peptidase